MFDFFRKHTRVLQFVLVLLIFPSFVFFGVEGYTRFREGGNESVAKVAGREVKKAEWDAAHRDQVERERRQNPNADLRQLDSHEARLMSLDAIVRERVLGAAADDLRLYTSDDRLKRIFASDPQLAGVRNPDGSLNKPMLALQGMTPEGFEQRLRNELSIRQVLDGVAATAVVPGSSAAAALDPLFQEREVQVQRFESSAYEAKLNPSDAELEAYYRDPANQARFRAPEQASVEYVVLDLEALKKTVNVPEEELRKNYEQNATRYTAPEQRRASHILIKAEKDAPKAERDQALARAQALVAELKKNPGAFADLARKNSQDPGSAANGGDLDFFARGAMVKPFEDTAFSLKPGETSDVVETDFGYHIIKLTDTRGGEKRAFEAVRPELENEVRTQLAQQEFSKLAVDFTNMVYEQADGLKAVADKFKLPLQQATGVTRTVNGTGGALDDPKLREALFSSDSVTKKRNTDAVETGPSRLVSARIVQYQAARQLPLDEVEPAVRRAVVAQQAAALARKDGEARLAEVSKAPQTSIADSVTVVSRAQGAGLPREVIEAALRADSSKLPTVTGTNLGSAGYALVRVIKVLPRDAARIDTPNVRAQFAQAWSEAEMAAYYNALKKRFKVDVHPPAAAASTPAL